MREHARSVSTLPERAGEHKAACALFVLPILAEFGWPGGETSRRATSSPPWFVTIARECPAAWLDYVIVGGAICARRTPRHSWVRVCPRLHRRRAPQRLSTTIRGSRDAQVRARRSYPRCNR